MQHDIPAQPVGDSASDDFLRHLRGVGTGRIRHVRTVPRRLASTAPWPEKTPPLARAAFEGQGIGELWTHQREALDLVLAGEHVVVSTGTASGKSLIYQVPMLAQGTRPESLTGSTALYLAPTKALAADQRTRLERLSVPGVRIATLDGDTPYDERRWIRQYADVILSNPDLLHHSLLPDHERWSRFWRSLDLVVVDECHVYRGVFGAHTAAVLRRLRRVAARYGAHPTFVLTSATSADPATHARHLTGLPVHAVSEDASPRPQVTMGLWEPGPPPGEADGRRSAVAESADLFAALVNADVQTLAFARSRVGVEVIAEMARSRLGGGDRAGKQVAAYRGGYLPEERRELERALRERRVGGLAATSALELGIDINGLDAVIVAGWPGTVASLRQQIGRAGRSGKDALALFVAADDPLDTYLVDHPEVFFDRPVEATVLDATNPHVLQPHLACAAAELPLTDQDEQIFGAQMWPLVENLTAHQLLRKRPTGWFWARDERPGDQVNLRGGGAEDVRIVEARTGRVLGTVDGQRAHSTVHRGAVYVHQGRSFIVTDLDLDDGSAHVVAGDPGWSTAARSVSSFDILEAERELSWGAAQLHFGSVRVRTQVTSFLRRLPSGEIIGEHALDLPEHSLVTRGVWWTAPRKLLTDAGIDEAEVAGALHAAEHCSIGLISLVAQGDRWDIGGVSTALHPDTELPTVVVYDALAGGSGFAERAFEKGATWLGAARDAIAGCSCELGCPACIQSPKCGNGNSPLAKAAAVRLLDAVLTEAFDPGDASSGDPARATATADHDAGPGTTTST